ncbi:hypothetical protein [Pseudomonas aeruginosa]|uniref:hypothetical protein n=1 Tax=Pseudomonas aeruginosa TaxID=287 RepID=UPI000ABB511C|nr:hypothetical protein [Pseudomonas aeruginosa]MBH4056964.1 hypothetical protein [Pseudomonas aeruginosa]MBI8596800.1 hypothetical protein [Pseudomonas aeruginosa]MBX6043434.1 hypothetical protein [Pseudomonas aeruginosa]MCK1186249.1 hypothetical protein [Pseudomonas aeruginosa]MCO3917417.1 hypothetical protein [Pseudomonas aeruginosa]
MDFLKQFESWPEEVWRSFGLDFLENNGWYRDYRSPYDVVIHNGTRYLVSFNHNIARGPVGTTIESDLIRRLRQAEANGFIGFYSGNYSTGLIERLESLNIKLKVLSGVHISVLLPFSTSSFIDKHFLGGERDTLRRANYFLNKPSPLTYKPLYCICGCGVDILKDPFSIGSSAAFIRLEGGRLYFLYGLKDCIFSLCHENTSCGWVELNQMLHPDQFNIWNGTINAYLSNNNYLDLKNFWKPRKLFTMRLLQRIRPINSGFFMDGEF